ncbi:PEP/pyruvate-binding domain-containing protein [Actinomadura vinacea]|uniref:PEP/pyruvate-binding domain-containing protein n=1 Tax=Actinomadura vinacea TaxID=115336 RepID=UPI0031CF4C3E
MPQNTRTLPLDDARATSAARTGPKAANLARAALHDLPVLPGFVIPIRPGAGDLHAAWARLSAHGERTLVVRSSSTQEDGAVSSMAGRFVSVLDVHGWPPFLAAIDEVIASASAPGTMAVLVQPQLDAVAGGVMFGADPVDGRTDRVIVSATPGGPQALVGGEVNGTRYALTRRGRLVGVEHDDGPAEEEGGPLTRVQLRALARLAVRAATVFGGPQDIEFAFDEDGRLWLLQSRPVTALAPVPPRRAPLLGPGPVAETLPDPLAPLEEDLWLVPLNSGLGEALATAGAVSRSALRSRPTVLTVGGRAAADLRRLGAAPGKRSHLQLLNPAPAIRKLAVAWQVGRLRADFPDLAARTGDEVDAELSAVPPLAELADAELAAALRWTRAALTSLHGLEALAGSLLTPEDSTTAAAQGLTALTEARALGLEDAQILAAAPSVLALIPPSIGPTRLPPTPLHEPETSPASAGPHPPKPSTPLAERPGTGTRGTTSGQTRAVTRTQRVETGGRGAVSGVGAGLGAREGLRLRVRWVQELGARLAWEAGLRLVSDGALPRPELVRVLRFDELVAAFEGGSLPAGLERRPAPPRTAPLPSVFRLAGERIVAESGPPGDGARPAGGGRGSGPVHAGPDAPPAGSVLVVRTLAPSLAAQLPSLAGLVAETGSPLSHLAILARELGVPTVVGLRGALDRFPPGTEVLVDGDAGTVTEGAA